MRSRTGGFTIIEVMVALVVGTILISLTLDALGPLQARMANRSAQQMFLSVHARARAYAVERGRTTRFRVDMAGDSAWFTFAGDRVEKVDFRDRLGVDLQSSTASLTMCLTSRGFADLDCNSFGSPVTVDFVAGGETSSAEVQPAGQIVF